MKDKIRILLADDHELIREGIKSLLASSESIVVVDETNTGEGVLEKVKSLPELDIVLLDINMPVLDGIETTKRLKQHHPEIGVIILTMYNRKEFIKNLVASGADGYVLKNSGKKSLIEAITSVASGEPYYGKEIVRTIMSTFKHRQDPEKMPEIDLSEREKEVIRLIVRENSTEEIAEKLFISRHTVNTHRKSILSKLGVKNVAGIIKYAIQTGIVKEYEL